MTALSWAKKEKSKGKLVSNAAIVFSLLCIRFGLNVQDTTHISGEENWRCDILSRLMQEKTTVTEALHKIERRDTKVVGMNDTEYTSMLLRNCDPKIQFDNDDDFVKFWNEIQHALNGIATHLVSYTTIEKTHHHDSQ